MRNVDFFYLYKEENLIYDNNGIALDKNDCQKLINILRNQTLELNQDEIKECKRRFHLENRFMNSSIKSNKIRPGYVYFAINGTGEIKIGCSKNVQKRMKGLKSQYGEHKLLYSFKFSDLYKAEHTFQQIFQNFHLHGEWFDIKDLNLKEILPTLAKYIEKRNKDEIISVIIKNNLDL